MSEHACRTCGVELTKKPGPGRWPAFCGECRQPKTSGVCRECGAQILGSRSGGPVRCVECRASRAASIVGLGCGGLTTSERARSAALARWAKTPSEQRGESAKKAAEALWAKWREENGRPTVSRSVRKAQVKCKPCPYCGTDMRGSRRKQCGAPECRKRYRAHRTRTYMHERRAKLRGVDAERFSPAEVYERDNWTCGICYMPVDPGLMWPDPRSVSLDHILPVSLGGPHTRENTRCSHLGCNSKRGNRIA